MCSAIVGIDGWEPTCRDPADVPSFDPVSDPAEDCELGLLGNAGRLLEALVDATNFFVGVPLFSNFAGEAEAGDGRISIPVFAVLVDEGSPPRVEASSSDPGGETNLAVGLGPDVEGPLGFFRIG